MNPATTPIQLAEENPQEIKNCRKRMRRNDYLLTDAQWHRRMAEKSQHESIREVHIQAAEALEQMEATHVELLNQAADELDEMEERTQHEVLFAARKAGPLWYQPYLWEAERLGKKLLVIPGKVLSWADYAGALLWLLGLGGVIWFGAHFGLGLNAAYSCVLLAVIAVLFAVSMAHWEYQGDIAKRKTAQFFCGLIAAVVVGQMILGGWCIAPQRGYVLLTTRNDELVRLVDTNDVFMRAPSLLKSEMLVFQELIPPEKLALPGKSDTLPRYHFSRDQILGETWKAQGAFRFADNSHIGARIEVRAVKFLKLENFPSLLESGQSALEFREELRVQVAVELDKFFTTVPNEQSIAALAQRIEGITNSIFGLENVSVEVEFDGFRTGN